MNEYWHSALLACEKYLNSPKIFIDQNLYKKVSNTFKEMRPWVKYGWEMVDNCPRNYQKRKSIK